MQGYQQSKRLFCNKLLHLAGLDTMKCIDQAW